MQVARSRENEVGCNESPNVSSHLAPRYAGGVARDRRTLLPVLDEALLALEHTLLDRLGRRVVALGIVDEVWIADGCLRREEVVERRKVVPFALRGAVSVSAHVREKAEEGLTLEGTLSTSLPSSDTRWLTARSSLRLQPETSAYRSPDLRSETCAPLFFPQLDAGLDLVQDLDLELLGLVLPEYCEAHELVLLRDLLAHLHLGVRADDERVRSRRDSQRRGCGRRDGRGELLELDDGELAMEWSHEDDMRC